MYKLIRTALSAVAVVGVAAGCFIGGSAVANVGSQSTNGDEQRDLIMVDPSAGQELYVEETANFPYPLPDGVGWPSLPDFLLKDGVRMDPIVAVIVPVSRTRSRTFTARAECLVGRRKTLLARSATSRGWNGLVM